MAKETGIWLVSLLIAAAFAAVRLRTLGLGWRWGKGWYLQMGAVAALAGLGLAGVAPVLCAVIGWAALLVPTFGAAAVQGRMQLALAAYDLAGARRMAGRLRWLAHAPVRRLAEAQVAALALALEGRHMEAEGPLLAFEAPDAPRTIRRAAQGARLFVRLHARDWSGIVALAEAMAPPPDPAPAEVAGPAARACLELGLAAEAAAWLSRLRVEAQGAHAALDQVAVPAFALLGARDELEATFARLGPKLMPPHFAAYWRGRCLHVTGDQAGAQAELTRALASLPEHLTEARRRVADGLATLADPPLVAPEAERLAAIATVRDAIGQARLGAEIARGAHPGAAPGVLVGLVAAPSVYVLAGTQGWVPGIAPMASWLAAQGALIGRHVRAGEWWRLLTHMGLHGHVTHLALNLLALLWLGNRTARLFGPAAMVTTFLIGGIAGGLAHVALDPLMPAVGASGGVMALLGMLLAGWVRARGLLPEKLRTRLQLELVAIIGIQLVFDMFVPQVAAAAHLGGLAAGAVVGALWPLAGARARAEG